jgi:CMP-N-acetylneuraminic acid synthetase
MKPLCIIPARGGSKRFPRKNVALLAGKPLIAYAIDAARESGVFDQVCVSSEDEEILKIASEFGADARKRDSKLSSDTAQMKHVCAAVLEEYQKQGKDYDAFALLPPTNPMRTAEDVKEAYNIFTSNECNFVMSVIRHGDPPQRAVWVKNGFVEPYFGLKHMKPAQELDDVFHDDGSIIFAKTVAFTEEGDFYGTKVLPYFIPRERSVDIDYPEDLQLAEFLLSR